MEDAVAERYVKAVAAEIERFRDSRALPQAVDSIYLGGGTPSLLAPGGVEAILSACRRSFSIAADCEISMEVNPGSLSAGDARACLRSGVNRISLGAQSFEDRELAAVGRNHDSAMIPESVGLLRANGFVNINLDLMLGLPLQTAASWRDSLRKAQDMAVPHISVYMLDLDEGCPLKSLVQSGSVPLPDEELLSDMYLETVERLQRSGYLQYEISNFCLPGFACRHNLKYWTRVPVYGFGLASHSFDGLSRSANYSRMDAYLGSVEAGGSPVQWRETVTGRRALQETLFLGLRLKQGVDWKRLEDGFANGEAGRYRDSLRSLAEGNLIEWEDCVVRLTPRGMLLSNEIFQLFV
jgi:oxygen-independent coproporphyrinogen-3 oxidase